MKPLFLSFLLLILFGNISKAQNKRWMYVTILDDQSIMLVDTIKSEIKQDELGTRYPSNAVTFWVMFYEKTVKNKIKTVTKTIEKITIDTVKKRFQSSSRVTYKNNKVIYTEDVTYDWRDIIPGTISEEFVRFAESLHNISLNLDMYLNAVNNKSHFPPLSETE